MVYIYKLYTYLSNQHFLFSFLKGKLFTNCQMSDKNERKTKNKSKKAQEETKQNPI